MTSPARAIGYLRVSSDGQAESGLGLEAQRSAITAAASRLGLELAEVHTDAGLSGKLGMENRPGLMAALGMLRRGDVLIVAKRDRLGRDVYVLSMIERTITGKRARLISAAGEGTDNDDGGSVMQRRVIDAMSEYERWLISQRTRAALKALRQRGMRAGNIPFGYRAEPDGRLVAQPDEQRILTMIRELREAGLTLRGIAEALNQAGEVTRHGTSWRHQYVAGLLEAA